MYLCLPCPYGSAPGRLPQSPSSERGPASPCALLKFPCPYIKLSFSNSVNRSLSLAIGGNSAREHCGYRRGRNQSLPDSSPPQSRPMDRLLRWPHGFQVPSFCALSLWPCPWAWRAHLFPPPSLASGPCGVPTPGPVSRVLMPERRHLSHTCWAAALSSVRALLPGTLDYGVKCWRGKRRKEKDRIFA